MAKQVNRQDLYDMVKACADGNLPWVKRLIKAGVEYEIGDYDGRTPIHLAASEGHLKIVKYMIEKANLKHFDPIDRWGNTPYDDAVRGGF